MVSADAYRSGKASVIRRRRHTDTLPPPPNFVARLHPQVKLALDAIVAGETVENAAIAAGLPPHEFHLSLFDHEIRSALAQLRGLMRERVKDAAFYQLSCLAGAIQDERYPQATSDMIRGAALKSVLGIGRDDPPDHQAKPGGSASPMPANRPPSLVITFGDKQEPRDITPTTEGQQSGDSGDDLS